VAPEVIMASNTSSISITKLAAATSRADRFIGMHFFNPVPMMALVEIIRGLQTSDATHDAVKAMAEALGKSPITVKNAPGFVVNRILVPMINEAFFVLAEGLATPEDIDAGMKLGCNQPIGPLALADMMGLDVCLAVMDVYLAEFGDSKYRPARCSRKWWPPAAWAARPGVAFTATDELGEAYTRWTTSQTCAWACCMPWGTHFTAGLDLPDDRALDAQRRKGRAAGPGGPMTTWARQATVAVTKPMVVAVKGITYTLGIELMLAADIVVAADNCRFSQLEVKRGIMATGGATLRMAQRAGLGNAMLHLLTGDEFDSSEALRLNFVQKVVHAGPRTGRSPVASPSALRRKPRWLWWPVAPERAQGGGAGAAGRDA
jgi:hypothetical protein